MIKHYRSEDNVMKVSKQTGDDNKFVIYMSEVLSYIAVGQLDYTVSSIHSILYPDAFDVGIMSAHTFYMLRNCRRISKSFEFNKAAKNIFE